jgi:hypothetical protein
VLNVHRRRRFTIGAIGGSQVRAIVVAQMLRSGCRFEYDGAPHGLLASHPRRLAADVLAFVSGTDARATTPVTVTAEMPLLYPMVSSII